MRAFPRQLAICCATAAAVVIVGGAVFSPPVLASPAARSLRTATAAFVHPCGTTSAPGFAHCHAILRPLGGPPPTGPAGFNPADLQAAYALPSASAGVGQTIAVVDAFDDPNAESDLAVYRATFGLPPCTTANGCFRKVNEHGSTRYPAVNTSWAAEISLDVDMVSASCPNCHILLVEARDASFRSLGAAVNEAAALGATVISNSYGGGESRADTRYDALYFDHPGVVITASSGDSGFGTQYPAASPFVTAVGGTTLARATTTARGWSEIAWSGAGSGCSAYDPQPVWQTLVPAIASACHMRAIADVAAVADPNTGVSVYDTMGEPGWVVFGGTSVAAPLVAGVYALAGNGGGTVYGLSPYLHASRLNDITVGGNGICGTALCAAQPGWDGPTATGTPADVGGF